MLLHFNAHEQQRIEEFRNHPLLLSFPSLPWAELLAVLLQRRHLSLAIVNVYEWVIDALDREAIRATVRQILHEEFPRNTRGVPLASHREWLYRDLLHLGASREQILTTAESPITREVREGSIQQLQRAFAEGPTDLALITFLRFWAEVLVAVEYECFWPRLSERLSHGTDGTGPKSEFFYYHMIHDRRQSDVGEEQLLGGLTHSQALAQHIGGLILEEQDLASALRQVDAAASLKRRFYDQFLTQPGGSAAAG